MQKIHPKRTKIRTVRGHSKIPVILGLCYTIIILLAITVTSYDFNETNDYEWSFNFLNDDYNSTAGNVSLIPQHSSYLIETLDHYINNTRGSITCHENGNGMYFNITNENVSELESFMIDGVAYCNNSAVGEENDPRYLFHAVQGITPVVSEFSVYLSAGDKLSSVNEDRQGYTNSLQYDYNLSKKGWFYFALKRECNAEEGATYLWNISDNETGILEDTYIRYEFPNWTFGQSFLYNERDDVQECGWSCAWNPNVTITNDSFWIENNTANQEHAFIKWNISNISSGSTITDSNLCIWQTEVAVGNFNVTTHLLWNNFTINGGEWVEGGNESKSVHVPPVNDDPCEDQDLCWDTRPNSTQYVNNSYSDEINMSGLSIQKVCFNVTTLIQEAVNLGYSNATIILKTKGGKAQGFYSAYPDRGTQESAPWTYRPYMNITMTTPGNTCDWYLILNDTIVDQDLLSEVTGNLNGDPGKYYIGSSWSWSTDPHPAYYCPISQMRYKRGTVPTNTVITTEIYPWAMKNTLELLATSGNGQPINNFSINHTDFNTSTSNGTIYKALDAFSTGYTTEPLQGINNLTSNNLPLIPYYTPQTTTFTIDLDFTTNIGYTDLSTNDTLNLYCDYNYSEHNGTNYATNYLVTNINDTETRNDSYFMAAGKENATYEINHSDWQDEIQTYCQICTFYGCNWSSNNMTIDEGDITMNLSFLATGSVGDATGVLWWWVEPDTNTSNNPTYQLASTYVNKTTNYTNRTLIISSNEYATTNVTINFSTQQTTYSITLDDALRELNFQQFGNEKSTTGFINNEEHTKYFTGSSIALNVTNYTNGAVGVIFNPIDGENHTQFFEFWNTLDTINETLEVLYDIDNFMFIKVVDTDNKPLYNVTVEAFYIESNITGYEYKGKIGQRLTGRDGKTFFWCDYATSIFYRITLAGHSTAEVVEICGEKEYTSNNPLFITIEQTETIANFPVWCSTTRDKIRNKTTDEFVVECISRYDKDVDVTTQYRENQGLPRYTLTRSSNYFNWMRRTIDSDDWDETTNDSISLLVYYEDVLTKNWTITYEPTAATNVFETDIEITPILLVLMIIIITAAATLITKSETLGVGTFITTSVIAMFISTAFLNMLWFVLLYGLIKGVTKVWQD